MNAEHNNLSMTPQERENCEQIAASGSNPHKQRAQALLLLARGASQDEATTQSGLTQNQIKYWLGRFRSFRLTIFPGELRTATGQSDTAAATVTDKPDSGENAQTKVARTAPAVAKPESKAGKEKTVKKNKKKDKKKDKKKNKKNKKDSKKSKKLKNKKLKNKKKDKKKKDKKDRKKPGK